MIEIPNKFLGELGPFATVSRTPDENGLYELRGCMWLIGFVTFKSPTEYGSLEGAVDFREMNTEEIERYLQEIEEMSKGRWDLEPFISSAKRKLGIS